MLRTAFHHLFIAMLHMLVQGRKTMASLHADDAPEPIESAVERRERLAQALLQILQADGSGIAAADGQMHSSCLVSQPFLSQPTSQKDGRKRLQPSILAPAHIYWRWTWRSTTTDQGQVVWWWYWFEVTRRWIRSRTCKIAVIKVRPGPGDLPNAKEVTLVEQAMA